jgi:molecular chaperone DnaK
VTAKDKATSKEQKVTITASTNLNKNDVERMVREASQHKEEDEKRKALIEARNMGDSTAYQAEKLLRDLGDKVDAAKRSELESKIKELRDSLTGDNASTINAAAQSVQTLMQDIGTAAYQQPQSGPAAGGGQPNSGPAQGGEDFVGRRIPRSIKHSRNAQAAAIWQPLFYAYDWRLQRLCAIKRMAACRLRT